MEHTSLKCFGVVVVPAEEQERECVYERKSVCVCTRMHMCVRERERVCVSAHLRFQKDDGGPPTFGLQVVFSLKTPNYQIGFLIFYFASSLPDR